MRMKKDRNKTLARPGLLGRELNVNYIIYFEGCDIAIARNVRVYASVC